MPPRFKESEYLLAAGPVVNDFVQLFFVRSGSAGRPPLPRGITVKIRPPRQQEISSVSVFMDNTLILFDNYFSQKRVPGAVSARFGAEFCGVDRHGPEFPGLFLGLPDPDGRFGPGFLPQKSRRGGPRRLGGLGGEGARARNQGGTSQNGRWFCGGGSRARDQDLMDLPVKSSSSRQLSLVKSPSVSLRNTTADRSAGDMRTRAK